MSFWSALFNGGRLLNQKVLLVSINYRLGVLGFFNLGTDDAPGNAGKYGDIYGSIYFPLLSMYRI